MSVVRWQVVMCVVSQSTRLRGPELRNNFNRKLGIWNMNRLE